jgi:hypothetical protein
MTLLTSLARVEAAASGRARPLSQVRHRQLAGEPLVIIPLTLAGDPATPVAAMTGTRRTDPHLLVVPQPRSRELRQEFFTSLARTVLSYITARQQATEIIPASRNHEERHRYADAPQILVPNRAARDYLGLLGRATRFQQTDGPYAVDPAIPVLGKWLTFFADSADHPGSALLADLTSMLSEHWATGQSPLEDSSLAAQLAWIDPPPGMTGLDAALATEDPLRCPPAGPATDPGFDLVVLERLMRNYDRATRTTSSAGIRRATAEITAALQGQLQPTWDDMWRAISLLRALPDTAGAARRWATDRDSFTSFSARLAGGGVPQPRRDHAATAAARLDRLERAQASYDAERAHEDPFVLAELRTSGDAFAGYVVWAEPGHTEVTAAGNTVLRPRFTISTVDPVRLEPGRVLISPARPRHRVQIAALARTTTDAHVVVEVTQGMGTRRRPNAGAVPAIGEQVSYTLDPGHFPQRQYPALDQTPWTHGGPPVRPPAGPAEEIQP